MRDKNDADAWAQFIDLYEPIIYRAARIKGLQHADAQDVAQQVLLSTANALEQRPHDPNQARFRTWLSRVTRNATLNALTRIKPDRGSGDSGVQATLEQLPIERNELIVDEEYERELFRIAARRTEPCFAQDSWKAFWLTTVEGLDIATVAEQLGKNPGSVYASRSRVMRKLRETIEELKQEWDSRG